MEKKYYEELKKHILSHIPQLRYIGLWNNQFIRGNNEPTTQQAFDYPCLFVEFNPMMQEDYMGGLQKYYYTIRLHLGTDCYLDNDFSIFDLKRKLYKHTNRWHIDNWSRLLRRNEILDYDHNNVNVYIIEYETTVIDYGTDITDGPTLLITNIEIDGQLLATASGI